MSKGTKNTIIVIAIVIIIFIIISVIYQKYQTKTIDANTVGGNVATDANTGLENMLNQIFDDESDEKEENKQKENVTNEESTDKNNNKNTQTSSSSNSSSSNSESGKNSSDKAKDDEKESNEAENAGTPRETKAIELVKEVWKKEWNNLDGVSFNVSIQSDGKYGVTVYETTTTKSIQFYIVDVDTGIVKER